MAPTPFAAAALTRRHTIAAATQILGAAGIESPRADAEWLLAGLLGVGRAALSLDADVPADVVARYARMVDRRAHREPLQRVLGWEEFHGLRFRLTDAVLVPRPETEVLVDWALALLPPASAGRLTVVDVGCGSGCIACAVARRRADLDVIALDASLEAAAVARANAASLAVSARVHVVAGDLLVAVRCRRVDLIVSNPPYLPTESLRSLAPEVTDHDPRLALDGGADGLDVIRRLVSGARDRLVPGGVLALETAGGAQARAVADLMNEAGFRHVLVHNDLTGTERFVAGQG